MPTSHDQRPGLDSAEPAPAPAAIARLASVGWFRVNSDRVVTAVSPELVRITGFGESEVVGQPCIALIRCPECLRGCALFQRGRIDDARLSLFRKDGREIEVVRAGEVVTDADGRATGAVETVRLADAGGESQSQRAAETLLESLGRMFVIVNEEQRVIAASSGLATEIGVPHSAMMGLPLERVFATHESLGAALAGNARREGLAAELRTKSGRRTPVSISIGPIAPESHCGAAGAHAAIMIRPADDPAKGDEIPSFEGIVGRSVAMQRIFRLIELLHDNDATVLVTGESGTGKEMVARALHTRSARRGPFVAVNCAALPADLLESELFGHVRGAFTGAVRDRPGRFELADHGTLFLDEIGDMPPALQAKLLRVLQDHAFERVGESRTRSVDVRVIAATHIDLARAVAAGRFREDLFYRLRVVPIHIPPLRERREDLTYLIAHLLQRIGARRGRALRLSPAAFEALAAAEWPGNVRELENALEYGTALCDGQTVHLEHLPPLASIATREPDHERDEGAATSVDEASVAYTVPLSREEQHELTALREALRRSHYRRDDAARALGMSRTTLWRKMKQYGL